MIDNKLSIVAVDEATQKVAGLFTAWDPKMFETLGFCKIMGLMGDYDKCIKKYPGLQYFIGVSEEV